MHITLSDITNDELSEASGGLITCFKPTLNSALNILSDSHTITIYYNTLSLGWSYHMFATACHALSGMLSSISSWTRSAMSVVISLRSVTVVSGQWP